MLDIRTQIICISDDNDSLPDLKYIYHDLSYSMNGGKLAIDESLLKIQINYIEESTFIDRKEQYNTNCMFVFGENCIIRSTNIIILAQLMTIKNIVIHG